MRKKYKKDKLRTRLRKRAMKYAEKLKKRESNI